MIARCQSVSGFYKIINKSNERDHAWSRQLNTCNAMSQYIVSLHVYIYLSFLGRVVKDVVNPSNFGQNRTKGKTVSKCREKYLQLLHWPIQANKKRHKDTTKSQLRWKTHIASDVVDSLITTWNETNEDGDVHNVTPSNNEIIEVWTRQTNNSAGMFNVNQEIRSTLVTTHFLLRNIKLNVRQTVVNISPKIAKKS